MGLLNEYIDKKMSITDLQTELQNLIKQYEKAQGTLLFIYAGAIGKPIPEIPMCMDDYYVIYDMLRESRSNKLDFYIETPGGSGEAAEEIARFLHEKFENVRFIVTGEAKSAGTILVLSGHDILMTKSGSLGPIDAQVRIGRCTISAYDYMEWIEQQRTIAANNKSLNPVDATVVAQVSPGEIKLVDNAKYFALDLVKSWLPKYKFASWKETESQKLPVTEDRKLAAADNVAQKLVDHGNWRSHGRSIKIQDLTEIGLKISMIDNDPTVADIVYRIQTVIRLLFLGSSSFKIFVMANQKMFRNAVSAKSQSVVPPGVAMPGMPEAVRLNIECPQCKTTYNLYAKTKASTKIDGDMTQQGCKPLPKDRKLKCACGFELDLNGIVNDLESKVGKKLI